MAILLCFLCFLPLILIFLKNLRPSKWNLPPGPPKLPIIGNLHQRGELNPRNRRNLSQKYGPVVHLRFGFVPMVVISSKEAAEEVLKTHDLECCNRPETAGIRMISYNAKDIGFAPYGEEWRAMRKLSVVELFSSKKIQSFRYAREEENDLLVKKLSESASEQSLVSLKKTLYALVGSIVCRVGLGQTLHECEFIDEDGIADLVQKSELLTRTSMFSDLFPGRVGELIDLFSGQTKRLENAFSELDTFFQNVLDDHLKPGRRVQEGSDIIDVMIDMIRKQDSFKITTDHLKGMISDIFLAGVSTSASTMIWAMTELIRNPRVMKKVQDEIRTTLGDKKERLTEEDLNQLHYFKLMVKEIFRLHPAAPLLLPRETMSHIKIQGYDIPKKTQILINAYAIARDPKVWKNPDEFDPDRFLDSSVDYRGLNFELLPFGAGRRICPGMAMGIVIVEFGLLNLLYFFDWGLAEEEAAEKITTGDEVALDFVQVILH
ncbi:cytochrome P450 71B28 [Raphanus sativus]|uniref:Cytochrome P450 71B28 n=1 Tax=Raphanus sativus TaxID=3726 RepID=A0A9W3C0M9_RAPSA|nr:cytochrome P450 71B28 [Raphanus sativus]